MDVDAMEFIAELVGQEYSGGLKPEGILHFQIRGTEDDEVAYAMLLATSPAVWRGLFRQTPRIREEGGGIWTADVQYGVNDQEGVSWSFEIGSENFHVTQAREHIADYPAGAENHYGAINVKKDSAGKVDVEGADVLSPTFTWEETHPLPYPMVANYAFITNLEFARGKCNHAPWRIWDTGEVLFLGATGTKKAAEPVPVTYKFSVSRSATDITVGTITGIDKEGHHYGWVEYGLIEEDNKLPARPKAVHIERNYDYVDFTTLGIDDDPWS